MKQNNQGKIILALSVPLAMAITIYFLLKKHDNKFIRERNKLIVA